MIYCMHWEESFILGFILIFSLVSVLPSAEGQYYSIDDNGIKHYILTPEISEPDNFLDDLTNLLLFRYENPWDASEELIDIKKISKLEFSTGNEIFFSIDNKEQIPLNLFSEAVLLLENNINSIITDDHLLTIESFENINSFFDLKNNPALLIFFLSLVGFILIKSENIKIQKHILNKIFTLFFIAILSSAVITVPISISDTYWFEAHAQQDYNNTTATQVLAITTAPQFQPITRATQIQTKT